MLYNNHVYGKGREQGSRTSFTGNPGDSVICFLYGKARFRMVGHPDADIWRWSQQTQPATAGSELLNAYDKA